MIPASRLCWETHRGIARHDGVELELRSMPVIAGLPDHIVELDCIAAMHRGSLRISAQATREMTHAECRAVQAWLIGFAATVREMV
jgi:hypothetical protein